MTESATAVENRRMVSPAEAAVRAGVPADQLPRDAASGLVDLGALSAASIGAVTVPQVTVLGRVRI